MPITFSLGAFRRVLGSIRMSLRVDDGSRIDRRSTLVFRDQAEKILRRPNLAFLATRIDLADFSCNRSYREDDGVLADRVRSRIDRRREGGVAGQLSASLEEVLDATKRFDLFRQRTTEEAVGVGGERSVCLIDMSGRDIERLVTLGGAETARSISIAISTRSDIEDVLKLKEDVLRMIINNATADVALRLSEGEAK